MDGAENDTSSNPGEEGKNIIRRTVQGNYFLIAQAQNFDPTNPNMTLERATATVCECISYGGRVR